MRGHEADPLSRGHICPKAFALQDVHEDPGMKHVDLDHVVEAEPGGREHRAEVVEAPLCLPRDVRVDQCAGGRVDGRLPGEEDVVAGADCLRVRSCSAWRIRAGRSFGSWLGVLRKSRREDAAESAVEAHWWSEGGRRPGSPSGVRGPGTDANR